MAKDPNAPVELDDLDEQLREEQLEDDTQPGAPGADEPAPDPSGLASADGESARQPRDDQGRFRGKGTPDASATVTEPVSAAPPATDGQPAPSPAPTEPSAWSFRADGQEIPIEGSRYGEFPGLGKGVFIPDASVPAVSRTLQQGIAHEGSFAQRMAAKDRQIEEATKSRSRRERQAEAILTEVNRIFSSEDEFLKFGEDFHKNRELLGERAKRIAAESRADQYVRVERTQETEAERAALEEEKDTVLEQVVLELAQQPGMDVFGQPELEELYRRLHRYRASLFSQATDDMYDDNGALIARRGQFVIDTPAVWAEMQRDAVHVRAVKERAAAAEKARAANAGALAGAGGSAPPTPSAGKSPSAVAEEPRKFKDADDYREYVSSGGTRGGTG